MLDQGIHKQPIYLLLNTSTANKENLDSWLNCIRLLVDTLRQSAYESMSIHLSLVGFDGSVNTLLPLSPISSFRIPEISCGDGQIWLGAALVGLKSLIVHDRIYHEDNYGYMRPKLFIFTDKDIEEDIKAELSAYRKAAGKDVFICTSKEAKRNKTYAKITKSIISAEEFDEEFIRYAMTWLSQSMGEDLELFNIENDFKDISTITCHCDYSFNEICLNKHLKSGESLADDFKLPKPVTYEASYPADDLQERMTVEPQKDVADMVYSSVFAPAEVKRRSRMVTQIYLHLHEEADTVCSLAKESLKRAERRDYIPLSVKLNKGDKVDIDFQIYGEDLLMSERKSVIWQGSFTKCSFSYFVPENIDIDELYCEAHLTINGAMVGEISFTTEIVESPRRIKPEIHSHQFKRIFISYAHADAEFVKGLALAYKFQGVDYFYDRDNINAGDIYEELIYEYIDSADLFILCWSQNAAASEYVDKERRRALSHAYPQKSVREATLKICPVCIAPKADLPDDMSSIYHFESIV